MKIEVRWYHLVGLTVLIGFVGISLSWWLPGNSRDPIPPQIHTTQEGQETQEVAPLTPEDTVGADTPEGTPTGGLADVSPLFEGSISFEEAQKRYPDAHPVVAMFKSSFTEEQYRALSADPEMKRFLELTETAEFAAFLDTNPTRREKDEFGAKHGFISDPDRYQKAFRKEFPTGTPEDFEQEMRQNFAELFRDADMENNPIGEIMTRAPQFLSDPRNAAWVKGYFDRDDGLGEWAENIVTNLDANLRDASDPENLLPDVPTETLETGADTSNPETVDMEMEADPIDAFLEEQATDDTPEPPGNQPPSPIDVSQLLTDGTPLTDENMENLLREKITPQQVSPEKFNRALETLNRYGPKEGLQRLKNTDPQTAEYFQRLIEQKEP